MHIILASSSPRRRELLSQAGYTFSIEIPQIDETRHHNEHAIDFVQRVAREKAHNVLETTISPDTNGLCIVAGDTAVVLNEKILGKPTDKPEAQRMLNELSGEHHKVISGVCMLLQRNRKIISKRIFASQTQVTFKSLSEKEINRYIDTDDPYDKAGAYGIQSGAAYMIRKINGSYTNVVGLPLTEVIEIMQEFEKISET